MTNKIQIWGAQIPGNSTREKRSVMEVKGGRLPKLLAVLRMVTAITKKEFKSERKTDIDSYTWNQVIGRGWEKETFEDVPTLEAYPVKGSRQAVIVIPGGAYAYKQTDFDAPDRQNEGRRVAEALNAQGITAFVLWYRSNPYYFPIPLLDVQRAIRFLRAHARDYGFDPDQISLIGFSAGGYQSLGFVNVFRGKISFPPDYQPDEIDSLPDNVLTASAGYPLASFRAMPNSAFAVMPGDEARDAAKREAFFRSHDLDLNFTSGDVPQFITYGTKDSLVRPQAVESYIRTVREQGGTVKAIPIPGAGHGYGANPGQKKAYFWVAEYIAWLKEIAKESRMQDLS